MGRGRGRPRKHPPVQQEAKGEEEEEEEKEKEVEVEVEVQEEEEEEIEETKDVLSTDADEQQEQEVDQVESAQDDGNQSEPNEEDASERLWETFKEEHYETVEQLPLSLHRMYRLIRDLDAQNQAHQREIQELLTTYYLCRRRMEPVPEPEPDTHASPRTGDDSERAQEGAHEQDRHHSNPPEDELPNGHGPSPHTPVHEHQVQIENQELPSAEEARKIITRVAVLLEEWVQNCEEKVNLTTAAYDSTDRHVRIIDAAFAEHMKAFSHSNDTELEEDDNIVIDNLPATTGSSKRRGSSRRHTKSSSSRDKKNKIAPPSESSHTTGINMEILPSEPRYCVCNQVSYGEMVGCDNPHCPREWFHLQCVFLDQIPDTNKSWYCPDCTTALGRKTRRKR